MGRGEMGMFGQTRTLFCGIGLFDDLVEGCLTQDPQPVYLSLTADGMTGRATSALFLLFLRW